MLLNKVSGSIPSLVIFHCVEKKIILTNTKEKKTVFLLHEETFVHFLECDILLAFQEFYLKETNNKIGSLFLQFLYNKKNMYTIFLKKIHTALNLHLIPTS